MERLNRTFARLRRTRRAALIPFLMAGDRNLATTARVLVALAEAGADVLEVGIPFSDPLADGPTIQRASMRALAAGTTPERVLEMLRRVAEQVHTPIVLLSYWNPIAQYRNGHRSSEQPFLDGMLRAGASGVVIPDLPPEEGEPFRRGARQRGIATVFLASPTSTPERLRQIAKASQGFIYYVSLTGTTGARRHLSTDWAHGVRQLKLITTKPVCVGFGISTPAQAAAVARSADGVIIGSALIRALEPHLRSPAAAARAAARFLKPFRSAL